MNRPGRKRELEVRAMFEPNRFTEENLSVAYELVAPVRRRWTRITKGKEENKVPKMARRAGGGL